MSKEGQIKRCFTQMIYGDALGFLNENNIENTMELKPFHYQRDKKLEMKLPQGQWSDLTELTLIITKSLIDEKDQAKVRVDYQRLKDELNLWSYYRHGSTNNILLRMKEGENYYQNPQYHNDKRGYGFSRIMPILLANKNFEAAKGEVIKQITYVNHHPQVIITGLLIARVTFTLLEKGLETREDLINHLKDFLIGLQRDQLTEDKKQEISKKYILQFEQEKINYLMVLDRLKDKKLPLQQPKLDSQGVFILALENLWRLQGGLLPELDYPPKADLKEIVALAFGFWGLATNPQGETNLNVKDKGFLESMGDYICKIRNYEVNRIPYQGPDKELDLFQLKVGTVLRHPIFNVMKVVSRHEREAYIEVDLETKTGSYRLYKNRM